MDFKWCEIDSGTQGYIPIYAVLAFLENPAKYKNM
jgi:hypothetical protein